MGEEIFAAAKQYLEYTEETVGDEFLALLVESVLETFRQQRNYPEDMTDEEIEADVNRYFRNKKSIVATQVIPAMLGKMGAEGQSALIDNQVSRYWANEAFPVYLPDVTPYCAVC